MLTHSHSLSVRSAQEPQGPELSSPDTSPAENPSAGGRQLGGEQTTEPTHGTGPGTQKPEADRPCGAQATARHPRPFAPRPSPHAASDPHGQPRGHPPSSPAPADSEGGLGPLDPPPGRAASPLCSPGVLTERQQPRPVQGQVHPQCGVTGRARQKDRLLLRLPWLPTYHRGDLPLADPHTPALPLPRG